MTLEQIDKRLNKFKEYLTYKTSQLSKYEIFDIYSKTGNLLQSNSSMSFDEWLVWGGYKELALIGDTEALKSADKACIPPMLAIAALGYLNTPKYK